MTRKESLTAFIKKTLLPVAVAAMLFFIFKSACTKDGITDFFFAVASVRTAVRNPSDVSLDHTWRSFFRREYRRVCIKHPARRGHRRDRPYMAVDRCSLVCAADGI